jgi:hypothetical protein
MDHLWSGGSLVDTIGKKDFYQYIVASHVIEHSVDLIGFLQDCESLLRPGGSLALVVPDKRYCFDFFKPLTAVGSAVDAHLRPTLFHPPGALLDHTAYATTRDGSIAWSVLQAGELQTQFSDLSDGAVQIEQGTEQSTYFDVHRWIFTPASLALLLDDLAELGYHSLREVGSAPTSGFEFYLTLSKSDAPAIGESRIERLKKIYAELRDAPAQTGIATDGTAADQLHAAQIELARAQAEIASLRASTSWRVTAPLRMLSGRVRRPGVRR